MRGLMLGTEAQKMPVPTSAMDPVYGTKSALKLMKTTEEGQRSHEYKIRLTIEG